MTRKVWLAVLRNSREYASVAHDMLLIGQATPSTSDHLYTGKLRFTQYIDDEIHVQPLLLTRANEDTE